MNKKNAEISFSIYLHLLRFPFSWVENFMVPDKTASCEVCADMISQSHKIAMHVKF